MKQTSKNRIGMFRTRLEQERRAIVRSIRRTRFEEDVEMGASADEADVAGDAHLQGLISMLHDSEAARLKAITEALRRIETEEWGLCANCQELLPEARLDAVPWATLCVRCQEESERDARDAERRTKNASK